MEEVMLVTEEMRRNIAYCDYEHNRWRSMAAAELERQEPAELPLDAAEAEGRRAYAFERAADEHLRAEQLTALWRPIYEDLLKTEFYRLLMVDPAFDAFKPVKRTETTAADDSQVLVMALADGLAMTTLENEDEPTCVKPST
jgi:hypothetical protein